jgi:multidrug resistance efflux pump
MHKQIILVAALAMTMAACSPGGTASIATPPQSGSPSPATPTAIPAREIAARAEVVADGMLVLAEPAIPLSFQTSAKVTQVNVSVGQHVKKGAVLAVVDDTAQQDALADAQAQLVLVEAQSAQSAAAPRQAEIDSAKAAVAAAYAQYNLDKKGATASEIEQARLKWQAAYQSRIAARWTRDEQCGSTPESQACKQGDATQGSSYESERTAYDSYQKLLLPATPEKLTQSYAAVAAAETKLKNLQAGQKEEQRKLDEQKVNQARANVDRAAEDLRKAQLVSPCDCSVQEVNIVTGTLSGTGSAITLLNLASLQFKTTNLSERDIVSIKVGAPVQVRLKTYDKPFQGSVSTLLPLADTNVTSSTVDASFNVLLTVEPNGVELLPGMTGQAEISVK